MFDSVESTWDQSARRRWTAIASFTLQALALSLLLAIPLLTIPGLPRLEWATSSFFTPPPASTPASAQNMQRSMHASSTSGVTILSPHSNSDRIADFHEKQAPEAPDFSAIGVNGSTGPASRGVSRAIGDTVALAPTPAPAPARPLRVSHWAEGNLIYRVQPSYPPLARQARIQGAVKLRAIISRTGTIENLVVLAGHAMLVTAAVEAVKQWRYHPFLLNGDPIEVETEITVNFTLSGS